MADSSWPVAPARRSRRCGLPSSYRVLSHWYWSRLSRWCSHLRQNVGFPAIHPRSGERGYLKINAGPCSPVALTGGPELGRMGPPCSAGLRHARRLFRRVVFSEQGRPGWVARRSSRPLVGWALLPVRTSSRGRVPSHESPLSRRQGRGDKRSLPRWTTAAGTGACPCWGCEFRTERINPLKKLKK